MCASRRRNGRVTDPCLQLLRRFKSLQNILAALTVAIVPVCNSFVLFGFVTMIYAVVGVHLFADAPGQDGHFDSFFQSFFTMFQVRLWVLVRLRG